VSPVVINPNDNAASQVNAVFAVMVQTDGTLAGVFQSVDFGKSWKELGPAPDLYGPYGKKPGNDKYLSLTADPEKPNVVYVGGRGQWYSADGKNQQLVGTLFRWGPVNVNGQEQWKWEPIAGKGANGSAPHPDSRAMVFDAAGNLLEADDGGIYRLVKPGLDSR